MPVNLRDMDGKILEAARNGNYDCARIMLEKAHKALEKPGDPSLEYVRECIGRFLMGERFLRAFNLHKAPRGRSRNRGRMTRDILLALEVEHLVETDDQTVAKAVEVVAEENRVSEATVRKALYPRPRKK